MNAPPAAPLPEDSKRRTSRRLVAALVLIGLAIVGLALVERSRQRVPLTPPPDEPSQALIAPQQGAALTASSEPEQAEPPPPPVIVNNEKLAGPSSKTRPAVKPPEKSAADTRAKGYTVQAGVFASPANARALQQQLAKAGIPAKIETRVQLGPFRNRREAEKALGELKRLGVDAVLVAPR